MSEKVTVPAARAAGAPPRSAVLRVWFVVVCALGRTAARVFGCYGCLATVFIREDGTVPFGNPTDLRWAVDLAEDLADPVLVLGEALERVSVQGVFVAAVWQQLR